MYQIIDCQNKVWDMWINYLLYLLLTTWKKPWKTQAGGSNKWRNEGPSKKHGELLICLKGRYLLDVDGFTIKYKSNETIERCKARLVLAKGYTQTYGIDYLETFALIAKINIVNILLPLAMNLTTTKLGYSGVLKCRCSLCCQLLQRWQLLQRFNGLQQCFVPATQTIAAF